MDQLIFASLSHTHYWYEVGMLKVPAVTSDRYIVSEGTHSTVKILGTLISPLMKKSSKLAVVP